MEKRFNSFLRLNILEKYGFIGALHEGGHQGEGDHGEEIQ
jgi:hypothetical protein